MLGVEFNIPAELTNDVVTLDESLPTRDEVEAIVRYQMEGVGLAIQENPSDSRDPSQYLEPKAETLAKVVEACIGSSAFAVEQNVAMNLQYDLPEGIDIEGLWAQKIANIESTKGLSVYRGGATLEDIGGIDEAKAYMSAILKGRSRPNVIVWLDEIEKSGLNSTGDLSGVNKDALGQTLTYMEDHNVYGVIFLGPPGVSKSQLAKSLGSVTNCLVIRMDMGAFKGSLVGSSEAAIRQAQKVITAVGNDRALYVATANNVDSLDTALQRRFTDIIFFDMPGADERKAIWPIWANHDFATGTRCDSPQVDGDWSKIDTTGWAGSDIKKCCEKAYRTGLTLEECAKRLVPVGVKCKEEIERLQKQADGKYLSATEPGAYRKPSNGERRDTPGRTKRSARI